jgi:hypothetical protein
MNNELHYLTFYGTRFLRVPSNLSDEFQFYCDQNGSTEALGKRLLLYFSAPFACTSKLIIYSS